MRHHRALRRLFIATAAIALIPLAQSTASAALLPDGTPIRVRLVGVINSETTTSGQPLQFVVTANIVSGQEILIKKGTLVGGVVVKARRVSWGFIPHHPKLAFVFRETTTFNGRVIALRASLIRRSKDCVVIDRLDLEHDLQWAGPADTFEAYVDGNYEL